jgi:hypothetical protein|tara:strand:+ start:1173 stop:1370 length:198 start_codon:yes stop_codon:yes gene_type:complete
LSKSEPCKGCDEFQVINILKKMAGGKPTSSVVEKPKPQSDEKPRLVQKPKVKIKKKKPESRQKKY